MEATQFKNRARSVIEIKQIKHFITVAEELNFRRAAERLNITQPPLSQSIKSLEETVGVKLIERNTRTVHLTKGGEAFLVESLKVLNVAHRSVSIARQAAQGEAGVFRLGYSASSIFSKILTSALAELLNESPMLELELSGGDALSHIKSLKSGKLDAAVIRSNLETNSRSGLSILQLGDEPLFVILNRDHRLNSKASISFKELDGERVLLQPSVQKTFLRRQLESLAEETGIALNRILEVPDIGSMFCFVAAGIGITILPASATSTAHGLVSIPLLEEGTSQPLILAYKAGNPLGEKLKKLISQ
ncbi:LysR substrate-binding domain-containing protein [uncultured Halomonas sp.]|uniref:LysR substrate-binding domain-containing protein n=1 Tax=uncultured Halomonas sp. TaxID=173971 RepID=UPI00261A3415|nr:LysR substrate-binding domain-containing protein [uncultured Halomonas sp.]